MRLFACAAALLPHAALIVSLIGFALLGAALFSTIEGTSAGAKARQLQQQNEYREHVKRVLTEAGGYSGEPEEAFVDIVGKNILTNFSAVWLQSPERWHFYGSLFFCCTVFTTVGYGDLSPVTQTGRLVCILYAMVGIPLMLLVINDVGDILAMLFSNSYKRLHSSCKRYFCRIWRPHLKSGKFAAVSDGTYVFGRDFGMQESQDEHRVTIQSSIKQMTEQLLYNVEIFDRIITKEKFKRKSPLVRSCSCPQLNQMPPPPKNFKIGDITSIGQEMDRFNVPFLVILLVVFAYILLWAWILPIWENELELFDAFYFCFITLTTIGFGDIVPKHPKFFMLTFLFIIMGMAIMGMAFKLGQSRIISCYRHLIHCLSCLSLSKTTKYDIQGQGKSNGK
ncbi:potassium channel subfamily K member 18 [Hoplias malabaricus]|uniref:potassium channel subfamily K member 18 n=1 Tax=Hoplias malabaricus TaxID=27720 RepID=UPI00346226AA